MQMVRMGRVRARAQSRRERPASGLANSAQEALLGRPVGLRHPDFSTVGVRFHPKREDVERFARGVLAERALGGAVAAAALLAPADSQRDDLRPENTSRKGLNRKIEPCAGRLRHFAAEGRRRHQRHMACPGADSESLDDDGVLDPAGLLPRQLLG